MRVHFLGDIALNGRYNEMYRDGINPFETLENDLEKADYVVGNLESFAKGDAGENQFKTPRLTTTVDTLHYLKYIKLDVACLANNHVYDHLESGFKNTVGFLDKNGIRYLGAGETIKKASEPLILEKDNIKIGILNYVDADTNPKIPDSAQISANYFNVEKVIEDIKRLKKNVNHVVLQLHWGGRVEGGTYPDFDQPKMAKHLIEHGADLIVGHHSHTFQPYEVYKGKYIFYSLGNFCFSDYWFEGSFRPLYNRNTLSAILNIAFTKSKYTPALYFYRNKIFFFESLVGYSTSFRNWWFRSFLKVKPIWHIYYLHLKYVLPLKHFLYRDDIKMREKFSRIYSSLSKKCKNDD